MTFNNARSGLNNATEYVVAGLPWVENRTVNTTPTKIELPLVSSRLSFQVSVGSAARVGFTLNGVNGVNWVLITSGSGYVNFDIRCKEFYIRADSATSTISVMAALTLIDQRNMPTLTGSATYNSSSTAGFVYGYGFPGCPGNGTGLG